MKDEEALNALEDVRRFQEGEYYGRQLLEAARQGNLCRVKEILELPADKGGLILLRLLSRDNANNSALHLAVMGGYTEVVEALLGAGVRPGSKNGLGQTEFDIADEVANEEVIDLLNCYRQAG